MIINTNITAMSSARLLSSSSSALSKSLARLSVGSKIISPEDDAAGLSQASKLHNENLRQTAALQTLANATSYLQTKDGFLQKVQKALDRMSELSVLAMDVTKTDTDRSNYNTEFQKLTNFISDVETQTYNGVTLFYNKFEIVNNGSAIDWTAAKSAAEQRGGHLATITSAGEETYLEQQLGGVPNKVWIGATDEVQEGTFKWVTGEAFDYTNWMPGEPNNAGNEDYVQLGLNAGDPRWNDYPDNGGGNVSNYLVESGFNILTDGIGSNFTLGSLGMPHVTADLGSITAANAALTTVKAAIDGLASLRAEVGGSLQRINAHVDELQMSRENLAAAVSRISDVDVAEESTNFARQNILVQSGIVMLAQANTTPQSALRLIAA